MSHTIELLHPDQCEHEDQYLCKCPMCGTVLDIDTHIFCLDNSQDEDRSMTICSDCFWGEEEWLVKEGFYDGDGGEDSDGWGSEYGFIHPFSNN
jgi:hypothetical protein